MNDTDAALRDALAARADAVTHDPEAYAEVVRRRARRRRTRAWSYAGATAAATAAVVVAATSLHRGSRPPRPAEPPKPPEYLMGSVFGGSALLRVVIDAPDAANPEIVTEGRLATALGDGRTFYVAKFRRPCTTTFVKVTAGTPDEVPVGETAAGAAEIAVSPDGRSLAYVADKPSPPGPPPSVPVDECDGGTELRVRDLATGQERVWPNRVPGKRVRIWSLTWSADSRYLAYEERGFNEDSWGFRVLDTEGAARTFLDPPVIGADVPGTKAGQVCHLVVPAYRGTTGELAAVRTCPLQGNTLGINNDIVIVDPATGTVQRLLLATEWDPVRGLDFDVSGTYLLIQRGDGDGPGLQWWYPGSEIQRVIVGDKTLRDASW